MGSVLIFGDAPSASVTRRVMGLLDACYPFAPKAGLLTDEAIGVQGKVKRGNQLYFYFLWGGGRNPRVFFHVYGLYGFQGDVSLFCCQLTSGEMLIQIAIF